MAGDIGQVHDCEGLWEFGTACGACPKCASTPSIARSVIRKLLTRLEHPWQSIVTAPKKSTFEFSGVIDILGKVWKKDTDTFSYRRFTDCYWDVGDSVCNRKPSWHGVDEDYLAVSWMPIPEIPNFLKKSP